MNAWLFHVRLRALLRAIGRSAAGPRLKNLRRDVGQLLRIAPVFVANDSKTFIEGHRQANLDEAARPYAEALARQKARRFHLRRFCLCCNEAMPMLVDYEACHVEADGSRTPNWRERLVCRGCQMNNRQRLVAKLVQQAAAPYDRPKVYLMEQVTPIFEWLRTLNTIEVHGSEYLGPAHKAGSRIRGVRHEDIMNLSYPDDSFDLIVSNDVMEHIPDPERALRECFRVLKRGGTVLATFPFHSAHETTRIRASLVGNTIEHLLPPEYHGNPLSSSGSLVFRDFGWDLLDTMRAVGFSPVHCEVYSSDEFGHLGTGLLVFRLGKPEAPAVERRMPAPGSDSHAA